MSGFVVPAQHEFSGGSVYTSSNFEARVRLIKTVIADLSPGDTLCRYPGSSKHSSEKVIFREKLKDNLWIFKDDMGRHETFTWSQLLDLVPIAADKREKWRRKQILKKWRRSYGS